jgi:hypothetical protein
MKLRIAAVVMALLGAAGVNACADYEVLVDPAGGLPDVLVATPSFSTHIEPILTKRCSIGGCHSLVTAQGGLSLTADLAYDELVNVESTQNDALWRVRPFRPDSSWLVQVVTAGPGGVEGYARMPLSSAPLTENQIGTIVNWITQGALRNE